MGLIRWDSEAWTFSGYLEQVRAMWIVGNLHGVKTMTKLTGGNSNPQRGTSTRQLQKAESDDMVADWNYFLPLEGYVDVGRPCQR